MKYTHLASADEEGDEEGDLEMEMQAREFCAKEK